MRILVFDTETTGLPSSNNLSIIETEQWPYIVQFSYIFYDTSTNTILYKSDNIIDIPEDIMITPKSIEIHKITNEKCKKEGIDIKTVLNQFNLYLKHADMIVGHNISFDKKMIMVECIRNNIYHYFNINGTKKIEYCTMKNSINLCKIPFNNSSPSLSEYKYPKLSELHNHLFREIPKGLHNSMMDVLITLRCFCKLYFDKDIKQYIS